MTFEPVGEGLWRARSEGNDAFADYAVVVQVRNRLHVAVSDVAFAVLPENGTSLPAVGSIPEHGYLWCEDSTLLHEDIPPDGTASMLCSLRIPLIERAPLDSLRELIRTMRSHPVSPWTRALVATRLDASPIESVALRDLGVDAMNGHGPSTRVDAGVFARTPASAPRRTARLTTCAERGDCERARLEPFEWLFADAALLVPFAIVPGYLVAGLGAMIRRRGPTLGVLVFAAFAAVLTPWLLHQAGGGYGPLLVLILLVGGTIGYAAGYALGCWARPPVSAP